MSLKQYLGSLSLSERAAFAGRCGTTVGHLRNISYGTRTCRESLAIAIERESGGQVRCETLCPEVDWAYLRNAAGATASGDHAL